MIDQDHGRYLTPPQIAHRLQMSPDRIIAAIRRGELRAADVAEPGTIRPRWRIAPEWLDAWLRSRMQAPPPPPQAQRRTRRPTHVIDRY
jgi:hypothetical protein